MFYVLLQQKNIDMKKKKNSKDITVLMNIMNVTFLMMETKYVKKDAQNLEG